MEEGKGIDDYLAGKAGVDLGKQREAFAELVGKAEPFVKTLLHSDIPILKKELHRTQSDSRCSTNSPERLASKSRRPRVP